MKRLRSTRKSNSGLLPARFDRPKSAEDGSKKFFRGSETSSSRGIQCKPAIGPPNDKFEQEADSVADRVVQRMDSGEIGDREPEAIQAKCTECEDKKKPRRQPEEERPEEAVQRQAEAEEPEEAIKRQEEAEEPQDEIQRQAETEESDSELQRQAEESASPEEVQRQSEGTGPEEETVQAKSESGGKPGHGAAQAADAVSSGGRPMTRTERSSFEPHFGRDFSQVRIHEDAGAGAAARKIRARAYTLGSNIAFAPGQYSPGSKSGRHLMAHELTHVVQQGKADTIRRARPKPKPIPATVPAAGPSDFIIDRVRDSTETRIRFARNSKVLNTSATAAIDAIKKAKPSSVKLQGFVSMDEATTLAEERAEAVKKELQAGADKVTVTSAKGKPESMASSRAFGKARSVEVIEAGKTGSTLDCKAVDPVSGKKVHPRRRPCAAMDPETLNKFNAAWIVAKEAMDHAVKSVQKTGSNQSGKPSKEAAALIDKFFGDHSWLTLFILRRNLGRLKDHVDKLDKKMRCGGQCDIGGCSGGGFIAYNSGVDAASKMTLCVPVFKGMNKNDQARNLIHESAHGTTPLGGPSNPTRGTRDVAYRHERMMFLLKPKDRLRNSDSYALFAMFLREIIVTGDPKAEPKGISTPALLLVSGFNTTEQSKLTLAIARLEKRLAWASSWTGQMFGRATEVKDKKKTWRGAGMDDVMIEAAKRFPLTKPPAAPTQADLIRIASIVERYRRMKSGAKQMLGIRKMAAGVVDWPAGSTFFASPQVKVGPKFFKARSDDQVSLLLQALAGATKDVETKFIPAYSSLARWIHKQNP